MPKRGGFDMGIWFKKLRVGQMKKILFIALLLSAANCFGEDFFRVVGIHDGDSITVLTVEKKQIKIRLEGIDAPELKQAFGSRAKEHLSSLIMGKDVTLIVKGEDLYKRTLSKILLDSQNVNLSMVRDGFAWHYSKYSKDKKFAEAEAEARIKKKGLWMDQNPVAPWDYRSNQKVKK